MDFQGVNERLSPMSRLSELLARATRRWIWRKWELVWLERDLAAPMPQTRRKAVSEIVDISNQNLDQFDPHFANKLPHYRRLLEIGAHGVGARDPGGLIYGVMWILRSIYDDELYYRCRFEVAPGEIFQFAGEIAPHRRGGFAALDVQRAVWSRYRDAGDSRSVCVVDRSNARSLKLHYKLGFRERGVVTRVYRLFGVFTFTRLDMYAAEERAVRPVVD